MKPSAFLHELWGPKPGGLIHLWRLRDKRSFYLQAPGSGDYYAEAQPDVYLGVALAHRDHGAHRRTRADQALAIAGLWLDIDVNGGPEQKTGAAPDLAAAMALTSALLEPTIVVSSGYGLHAWWLFATPWIFTSKAEQHTAAVMSAQWYALHRAWARDRDPAWGIDHTHDLARLLRLPSTVNAKGGRRAPVEVVEHTRRRYTPDALRALAADAGPIDLAAPGEQLQLGDVTIAAGRHLPDGVLDALLEDPTFASTWTHAHRVGDGSMSSYDLSIANQLVAAGVTDDQLIANVICAHRLAHDPADRKHLRTKYLRDTIARARAPRPLTDREQAAAGLAALAEQGRAAA